MSTKHFLTRDPHDANILHLYEEHGRSVHHVHSMSTEDLVTVYGPDGGCILNAIADGEWDGGPLPISYRAKLNDDDRRRFSREQRAMDAADQAAEDQAALEQRRAS